MRYIPIPEDRFPDVIIHLRYTFFPDEPLNKSLDLCGVGEAHTELELHSWSTMEQGFSVMALDDENEIAGVCLNGVARPGDIERGIKELNKNPDEVFKNIFNLLYGENKKLDLFRRYGVDSIFELRILSVDSKFRGQGVARKLIEESQLIAIKNGLSLLKGEATGLFSKKILAANQFAIVSETRYDCKHNADGSPMFPVALPHESLCIMIKQIPNKKPINGHEDKK